MSNENERYPATHDDGTTTVEFDDQSFASATLDDALVPTGVEARDEIAHTRRVERDERPLIDRLQGMTHAAALFKQRAELLQKCRTYAVRETNPRDWVLMRPKGGPDDSVVAFPDRTACSKIIDVYGIEVYDVRPVGSDGGFAPDRIVHQVEGREVVTLRAWCRARSRVTGRVVEMIEAARATNEQFTGRGTEQDLRSALLTLLLSKSARVISGLSSVPLRSLDEAWEGTGKSTAQCTKGSGFGSSADRRGEELADSDATAAAALWRDVVGYCRNDMNEASTLLRTITSFKKADGSMYMGIGDFKQFRSDRQIAAARRAFGELLKKDGQQ